MAMGGAEPFYGHQPKVHRLSRGAHSKSCTIDPSRSIILNDSDHPCETRSEPCALDGACSIFRVEPEDGKQGHLNHCLNFLVFGAGYAHIKNIFFRGQEFST